MTEPRQIIFAEGTQKIEIARQGAFEFNGGKMEQSFGISVPLKDTAQSVFQCGSSAVCFGIEFFRFAEINLPRRRDTDMRKEVRGHENTLRSNESRSFYLFRIQKQGQ